jgi:hypothetical protein
MYSKRLTQAMDTPAEELGATYKRLDENWVRRLWTEVRYRWCIAISAPGRERARQMEHERIYAEHHRLAEEYSRDISTDGTNAMRHVWTPWKMK